MISISVTTFKEQQETIQSLRHRVFTQEQGVDPVIDLDGQDHQATHVLALADNKPVGTGRMLDDGHIGRIAVLKESRQQGIGKQIMETLIRSARKQGIASVFLGAQVDAVPFYENLGFSRSGDNYIEANILHTPMFLELLAE